MKNLTYRELAETISKMNDEQKNTNVTVHCGNCEEFYPIKDISIITETGVLDAGHPVLNTPYSY